MYDSWLFWNGFLPTLGPLLIYLVVSTSMWLVVGRGENSKSFGDFAKNALAALDPLAWLFIGTVTCFVAAYTLQIAAATPETSVPIPFSLPWEATLSKRQVSSFAIGLSIAMLAVQAFAIQARAGKDDWSPRPRLWLFTIPVLLACLLLGSSANEIRMGNGSEVKTDESATQYHERLGSRPERRGSASLVGASDRSLGSRP